jgi:hypothetical protein
MLSHYHQCLVIRTDSTLDYACVMDVPLLDLCPLRVRLKQPTDLESMKA